MLRLTDFATLRYFFNLRILARLEDFVDLDILINLKKNVEFNILLHFGCFVDRDFTILGKLYTVRHFTTYRRFCRPYTFYYSVNVSNLSLV